jgi:two-component system LytT family response regulator
MKIKTVIIEDEEPAVNLILKYLEDDENIEVKSVCKNGFEGLKACSEHKPDFIFLDIQMPKLNGFEMLEIMEEIPYIIFTTAYDEFALKAFEANAVDYLLKPFGKQRFLEAIEKVSERMKNNISKNTLKMKTLVESRQKMYESLERIVVKSGKNIHIIDVEEIIHIDSDGDYVRIFTNSGKFLKENTLKYYETALNPKTFVRIHRTGILNINFMEKIELFEKESYLVHLKNGEKIKASQSGYKLLKEKLGF